MESWENKPVWKEPTWEPLERIIGRQNLPAFMYMGEAQRGEKRIVLYKHIGTRSYLNLDEEGGAFLSTKLWLMPMECLRCWADLRSVFDQFVGRRFSFIKLSPQK